jgi:hypothetical protein
LPRSICVHTERFEEHVQSSNELFGSSEGETQGLSELLRSSGELFKLSGQLPRSSEEPVGPSAQLFGMSEGSSGVPTNSPDNPENSLGHPNNSLDGLKDKKKMKGMRTERTAYKQRIFYLLIIKKLKIMAKHYFVPKGDLERVDWLKNFSGKVGGYQLKYNIDPLEVTDTQNGYLNIAYWMDNQHQSKEYQKKLTGFKDEMLGGVPAGGTASVQPSPPVFAAPPTAVAPGILKRATALGNVIKNKSTYTVADGEDLGLEGTEITVDLDSIKPAIKLVLVAGGHPEVKWTKQGMDGIEIYVDRGTGTYVLLAFDTHPDYMDTAPLPATGATAVWNYKSIYRFGDNQVGLWSDVVSITVTGS